MLHRSAMHRLCRKLAVLAVAGAWAAAVPAEAITPARVEVAAPEGFDDLTAPQEALVDVFYGGRKIGQTRVRYTPDTLEFLDPSGVVALLPGLADRAAVLSALSTSELPTHSNLVCTTGADPAVCGRLAPTVAGVIFNQDRFRVDIYVEASLLEVQQAVAEEYLSAPQPGMSLINGMGGVVSGSADSDPHYNFQDRFILSDGNKRLASDLSYSSTFGLEADRLTVEIDRPGWRYSGGAFWTPGTDLIGRRKVIGVGIETQTDTRLDKDTLRGTPLVVFLNQRARVEILRDRRVLASRIYEAGNQELDTSTLPDGSYEVVLRIEDAGGEARRERRFFTKNRNITAPGQDVYFAYAGVLSETGSHQFLAPTSTAFFQGGAARRLGPHFAVDGTLLMADKTALAQLGGYYIGSAAQVRVAALAASNGAIGGLLQVNSQSNSRFNFSFDLRHVATGNKRSVLDFGEVAAAQDTSLTPSSLPVARGTFTQLSGNLSYSLLRAQLSVNGSIRSDRYRGTTYYVGPSVRWEVLRRGRLQAGVNADGFVSDRGTSWFAGLNLQLLGRRTSLTSVAGVRSTAYANEASKTGFVGGIGGTWQHEVGGAELALGGSYERDLDRQLITGSADMRGDKISLNGQAIQGLGKYSAPLQYSLGFNTSVAVVGGTIALEGRNQSDGMVVVKVDGMKPDDQFQVIVGNQEVGAVKMGEKLAIPLAAYGQYDVRVRPIGKNLVSYDGAARRVAIYPGNAAELSWRVDPVVALFGRLVLEDGQPARYAAIRSGTSVSEADAAGYFQIETAENATLEVKLPDGSACDVGVPVLTPANGYSSAGTLICRALRKELQLTAADSPARANETGSAF
jgi:hypothetical protein